MFGLWNTWADPTTGEVFAIYKSMLTMNRDEHALWRRFHGAWQAAVIG